jgi:hypothetical protein
LHDTGEARAASLRHAQPQRSLLNSTCSLHQSPTVAQQAVQRVRDQARLPCVLRRRRRRGAQVRELPKTMLAAKSFERTGSPAAIARWLRILAEELAERLAVDGAEHARRPRSLSVTYRRAAGARGAGRRWDAGLGACLIWGGGILGAVQRRKGPGDAVMYILIIRVTALANGPPALAFRSASRSAWPMGA